MIGLTFNIKSGKAWYPAYYAYLWKKIQKKWYQKNNMIVLEKGLAESPSHVYFPYIEELIKNTEFNNLANKLELLEVGKEQNPFSIEAFSKFDETEFEDVPKSFNTKIQTAINLFNDSFLVRFSDLFDHADETLIINIYPSTIGTQGSYFVDLEKHTLDITLHKSVTSVEYRLLKTIVYYFVNKYYSKNNQENWLHREAVVIFL
jgi:hypothetical protein